MDGAHPRIANVSKVNSDVFERVSPRFGPEDRLLACCKEVSVRRKIAIHHREPRLFVVHIQGAANDDHCHRVSRPEVFTHEVHKLRKTERAIEIEFRSDWTFMRAGEKLLQLENLFFELVRARLAALKSAQIRNLESRNVGQIVRVINGE